MHNFEFHNPVHILFGKGTIAQISGLLPADSRVMILYGGGSIKQNGVFAQVTNALKGFEFTEFGGIEANPQAATCDRAAAAIRQAGSTFILAVGGGSVADAAKLIAAAALVPDKQAWDLVLDTKLIKATLPIGVVLTLPATGSEMNTNSVISHIESHDKRGWSSPFVYPVFSILDPETTYSLPPRQVANGIVDTWVHVCEQYLTWNVNSPIQDKQAEGILLTLLDQGPRAMLNPHNYEVRANLMWASTMALNGLIGLGVPQDWASHGIGHELTAAYGLDHGRSLAVVLPGVLSLQKKRKKDKLLQYARNVWGLHQGDENVLMDEAIARTVLFFESLGVGTTLRSYGIGPEAADIVAAQLREKGAFLGEHGDIGPEEAHYILTQRAG